MQTLGNTYSEALAQLARTEDYLGADPDNAGLLARAIDQSLAAGDTARAQRHAEHALALFPSDPFFRCRRAHVHSAQGRWSDAAVLYAELLDGHPDIGIAYSLAHCQLWMGTYLEALDTFAPYRSAPDLTPDAVVLLVRALHQTGQLEQAIELAEQHRARLGDHPVLMAAVGLVYLDEGDLEQASACSALAMSGGARLPEALVVQATVALASMRNEEAAALLEEVIATNPHDGRSWSCLGMASLLGRDLVQAERQLQKAVELMPAHIGSWHCLAWCKLFSGELDAAESAFTQALELDRNFGESHGGVAVIAALRGDADAASAGIVRALKLDRGGLAARYAQMVLSGDTADPEHFRELAYKLMRTRVAANGEPLADLVRRQIVG